MGLKGRARFLSDELPAGDDEQDEEDEAEHEVLNLIERGDAHQVPPVSVRSYAVALTAPSPRFASANSLYFTELPGALHAVTAPFRSARGRQLLTE
jgi:hypothetical protein